MYENLTMDIHSSCIIIMMVKVVNIIVRASCISNVDAGASMSLRPTLDLDSDKFQCFNHRR